MKCGCKIDDDVIMFCSLHTAAEGILEALKILVHHHGSINHNDSVMVEHAKQMIAIADKKP